MDLGALKEQDVPLAAGSSPYFLFPLLNYGTKQTFSRLNCSFKILFILFHVYECQLACMSASCVYAVPKRPEEDSDPLQLEFQVFVSHCVGAGNRTRAMCKSSQCPHLLSHHLPNSSLLLVRHFVKETRLELTRWPQPAPQTVIQAIAVFAMTATLIRE